MNAIEIVIEGLAMIRVKPYSIRYGICGNFSDYLNDRISDTLAWYDIGKTFQNTLEAVSCEWDKYSGDKVFPISGHGIYSTHRQVGSLWKSEQLELRIELIDLMLKYLETQLEKNRC